MMRKVRDRSLGQHTRTRPPSAKSNQAIKVPISAVQHGRREGEIGLGFAHFGPLAGCGKGARRMRETESAGSYLGPNDACFRGSRRACHQRRLRLRHLLETFCKKSSAIRQLGEGPRVSQPATALQEAKPEMPTFYSSCDFSLIRLHERRAGPISIFSNHSPTSRAQHDLRRRD